ncbi:MAG: NAD(P)/FAD-dependent oxidoreductase [Rhodoblastus sp.]
MISLPSPIDVAVIGAGAAGIAAARRLKQAGVPALLIEARGRVGGRAHTAPAAGDVIDLGCEWLHSADRNVLVGVAERLGFVVDRGTPGWSTPASVGLSAADHADYRKTISEFFDAVETAASDGPDRPASDLLQANGRWNMLLRAMGTYYSGAELENISVVDLARYEDTHVNWTIREGYGAMIAGAAEGLPVVFDCAVTRIDHAGRRVKIETGRGTIEAKAAIVCVPTPLIARCEIRFDPALPDKQAAAAGLPLGLADKVFFEIVGGPNFPSGHFYGATDRAETFSFDLFPRGRRLLAGFVGGAFARDLEKNGPAAMEAEARRQIASALGADAMKHLRFLCATAWDLDPFARGGYSCALPGHADDRAILAAPVNDRLFFAGEACSRTHFSTTHGAWETGWNAAEEYLEMRRFSLSAPAGRGPG